MPYKNPEDKRRWEHEHRQQRNARRRKQGSEMKSSTARKMLDPASAKEATSDWKVLAGMAVGIGVVLLTVFFGVSQINSAAFSSINLGKNSGQ